MTTAVDFFRSLLHHNEQDTFSLLFPSAKGVPVKRIGYIREIKKGRQTVTDVIFEVLDPETGVADTRGWHNDGESKVFPKLEFIGFLRDCSKLTLMAKRKIPLRDLLLPFGLRVPYWQ